MKRSPIVYFLFFFSGITALIYEIVWTRMLTLVFGHTVFSVSVVLAAFMAGLGFGSYYFGCAIDRIWDENGNSSGGGPGDEGWDADLPEGWKTPVPLLVYGWIEILIFVLCAVLSLVFFKFSVVYSWLSAFLPESAALHNTVKAALAFGLMFFPATLMGATLPIISKYYVTEDTKLGSQMGILYGVNTFGAAFGCLLTGFFLLSTFGVLQTVLGTALLNLFIGVCAIRIYQESGGTQLGLRLPYLTLPKFEWSPEQKFWMAVSFVCGFTALAYEVLWTRLLVFSISSTVYSFSMMLGVFLLGIVLGSFFVIPVFRLELNVRTVLIGLQAGIAIYVIGSLYSMEQLLSAPWNSYNLQDPVAAFSRYFRDSSALMLLPTIALGMSFPILIKLISGGHKHIGRGTGQIYGANTLGAIFGSLVTGFLLLPGLGTQQSLLLVATLNLVLVMFLFRTGNYLTVALRKVLTVVLAGIVLAVNVGMPPNLLDRFFMRDSVGQRDLRQLLYFEEGLTDTVAVFEDNYGILDPDAKRLITNGISMSAANLVASRYMKLFAHVPILLLDNPENVLVVCFGTGQTTGAAGIHPGVKSVDSLDLSASVVRAGTIFASQNHDALNNKKINIILQDGRNHLLTTRKMYDVITSEPPPPRTAFTVNLYTREYYEMARKRLKSGGIMAQWIPLHSQGEDEVRMHFKTFLSVFPHAMAWMSVANEILIIGSDRPIEINFGKLQERLLDPVIHRVMEAIQIPDVYSFLGNIWFMEDQMTALAEGQPVISDNRPIIEFYLDLGHVIGLPGREKLVFTRVSFADIAGRISGMTREDKKRLETFYDAMDLYQRGVMYSNREQLLEALTLMGDSDLVRYHLQAGTRQVSALIHEVNANPSNLEALLNLGHAYYQIGEYEKSLGFLEIVLEKEPQQPHANLYAGYNLMQLERRDEAKTYFETAARSNPAQLGAVMQELALIDLHARLDSDPENPSLLNAVAQFYNIKNEYRKSLGYSFKVLEKDPLNKKALQSIVFSYRGRGEPGEVLDYGNRYAMIDPDEINLQYIFGEIYAKTLRCEKAVPYLKNVLKRDDTFRDAQTLLNECLPRRPTGDEG
ncbi:spermidine synthase [Candidatus Nitromaritima sp. SCGC AAA799-C22]|nr:spermidine synthase [Candidatus Nitromaritima sp. SCGC AAA799-C22]